MRALMRSLAPTSFDDVAALVALYRPGPMAANMHNDYADRKNGRKPVEYFHPDAEELLADTYGPDDLPGVGDAGGAEVRRLLAGRGRQPAQGVRQEDPRAHGQGAGEVRRRVRAHRLRRDARQPAVRHHRAVRRLRLQQEPRVRLRLIAYQTAYLKAHYPVEYLAALLTSVKANLDKAAVYLAECRQHGHQGARARRQPLGVRLRAGVDPSTTAPSVDPVRPVGGAQRRRRPGRADHRRARRPTGPSSTSTTSASGSTLRCSTSGRSSR